jgi:hypothetical protein
MAIVIVSSRLRIRVFGGPLETRTPDPLIKTKDPQHTSQPDPDAIPRKSKQIGQAAVPMGDGAM